MSNVVQHRGLRQVYMSTTVVIKTDWCGSAMILIAILTFFDHKHNANKGTVLLNLNLRFIDTWWMWNLPWIHRDIQLSRKPESVTTLNPLQGNQYQMQFKLTFRSGMQFKNKDTEIPKKGVWEEFGHPTPPRPSITKSVKWRHLRSKAWYHRSASVKTTGKKF